MHIVRVDGPMALYSNIMQHLTMHEIIVLVATDKLFHVWSYMVICSSMMPLGILGLSICTMFMSRLPCCSAMPTGQCQFSDAQLVVGIFMSCMILHDVSHIVTSCHANSFFSCLIFLVILRILCHVCHI